MLKRNTCQACTKTKTPDFSVFWLDQHADQIWRMFVELYAMYKTQWHMVAI